MYFSPINFEMSVRFDLADNWLKPAIKVIDRTNAVTKHLLEKSFKKKKNIKNS